MIRKARNSDLQAVRQCAWEAYSIYVGRIGREPAPMVADFEVLEKTGHLYVEQSETGRIAGYVVFYRRDDHMHLENVAVDPVFQGRGIGRRLIEFVENSAVDQGLDRVELYTNMMMYENLELYPRLGYLRFARRMEDGFDRVFFRKTLT